jgi:hypothetical protein
MICLNKDKNVNTDKVGHLLSVISVITPVITADKKSLSRNLLAQSCADVLYIKCCKQIAEEFGMKIDFDY